MQSNKYCIQLHLVQEYNLSGAHMYLIPYSQHDDAGSSAFYTIQRPYTMDINTSAFNSIVGERPLPVSLPAPPCYWHCTGTTRLYSLIDVYLIYNREIVTNLHITYSRSYS